MRIAILTPFFNAEKTIARAVRSIAEQNYSDLYCVFVDNASTDNSFRVCLNEARSRLKSPFIMLSCKEKGIVPALNCGLFEILGNPFECDAVARLDADDIWLPTKLHKQVAFLDRNPEISLLGTQMVQYYGNEEEFEDRADYSNPVDHISIVRKLFETGNAMCHPTVMVRTSVYRRVGVYDDLFPFAEDYSFWLKAAAHFKFANIDEPLVKYLVKHNPLYNPRAANICRDIYGRSILNMGRVAL